MRISIDLDNTVFNLAELYRQIIESHKCTYVAPKSYDVYENGYPTTIADALYDMITSDAVHHTRVFDTKIPDILNSIYKNPKHELFYITERLVSERIPTIQQLQRANIICDDNHLIHGKPKIDILKEHKIDLCFDDAPHVVSDCIANNIGVVMISNDDTAYNHHLRGTVEHYPTLIQALEQHVFFNTKDK